MKHYVSPTGTYFPSSGSKADPLNLQYAIDGAEGTVHSGDTIKLLPGEYDPITCTKKYNDYITIEGSDGVIIKGSTKFDSKNDSRGIIVVYAEYYRFKNLHIHGNNPIRDSRIETVQGVSHGIALLGGSNIDIIGCHIENTTGSGIYKSSSCKNVSILGNIVRYNGYYSVKKNRYAHHGLYIQNQEDSYCNIEKNIISHAMSYGTQVWQQSGPHKQESKLLNVVFEDNIFISHNETALLYGGYNYGKGGIIRGNSVYPISSNGIRVGYSVTGNSNVNTNFVVSDNIIHGNLMIINPKVNPSEQERIYVQDNVIARPGYAFSIYTNKADTLDSIINTWKGNKVIASSSKPFQWINWIDQDDKPIQEFNTTLSLENFLNQGYPVSNTHDTEISNIIRYIPNLELETVYIAVHNFENQEAIEINLDPYFKDDDIIEILDIENMAKVIYTGTTGDIIINIDQLPDIEPVFGNLPTPKKSDDNFACFIVKKVPEVIDEEEPEETEPEEEEIVSEIRKINIVNEHYRVFVDDIAAESYNTKLSEAIEDAVYIKQTNPGKIVTIKLDKGQIRIDLE